MIRTYRGDMKLKETRFKLKVKDVTFEVQFSWLIDLAVSIVMLLIVHRVK
jgi:hypothetical protein